MTTIALNGMHSEGRTALVDDTNVHLVENYTWWVKKHRNSMYAVTDIDGKRVYMHRLILCAQKGSVVDHIDGNGLNNTVDNIRIISSKDNVRHRVHKNKNNSSLYRGVIFKKGKWLARIGVDYKTLYLGSFYSPMEAAKAYDTAALFHFGEYAVVNIKKET